MFRNTFVRSVVLTLAAFGAISSSAFAARPTAAQLLPDTTVVIATVRNASELFTKFQTTNFGQMINDPQVAPLADSAYSKFSQFAKLMKGDSAIVSADEIVEIIKAGVGECAVAVVPVEGQEPAFVLFIDCGDQFGKCHAIFERLSNFAKDSGIPADEETIGKDKVLIYDLNKNGHNRSFYCEKDSSIVITTQMTTMKDILAAWNNGSNSSLANSSSYSTAMSKCRGGANVEPQMTGFIDYIGLLYAIPNLKSQTMMFSALGVDGLMGLGGCLYFDTDGYEFLMHVHALTDNPRTGVLKVLAFDKTQMKPSHWIPGNASGYVALKWDFAKMLSSLKTVVDSFMGDGALSRFLARNNGSLGVDVEKQILPLIDGQVEMVSWVAEKGPQGAVYGFKVKDSDAAKKIMDQIAKTVSKDVEKHGVEGGTYYVIPVKVPENFPDPENFPHPAFGLFGDMFLFSPQAGYVEKAAELFAKNESPLADDLEYKLISNKTERICGAAAPSLFSFSRPEESYRYLYDQVSTPEGLEKLKAQARFNPGIQGILNVVEGNSLPPFSALQKYLAPTGAAVTDEETGVHYVYFSMKRKAAK